jgi:ATP-dependent Clp protease ATP-binding subunit ClpC
MLPKAFGAFFIVLPFWLISVALQAFYFSYYYKGVPDTYGDQKVHPIQFELAHIIFKTSDSDVLADFLMSYEGIELLRRSGITPEEVSRFLTTRTKVTVASELIFPDADHITVEDYVSVLFDHDQGFSQLLFSHEIQKKDVGAIMQWIMEREISVKLKKRWWAKDNLGRVPGLGKNWSYGQLIYLDEYARALPEVQTTGFEVHSTYGTKELEALEAILVKTKGANAFLVSDDKEGQLQIIARLSHLISEGTALPELVQKRVIVFDTDLLTATSKTKNEFETKLLQIMTNTAKAGNVILVIADFASFLSSAQTLGSDIVSLLDQHFTAPELHIVGLTDVEHFHTVIENNAALKQRFESIIVEAIDEFNVIRVLENECIPLENKFDIYFTYPALMEIAEGAERYFPDAVLPDSAIDLIVELGPKIAAQGKELVTKKDVLDLIQTKTGMPVGDVQVEERNKLMNLETLLHQRIIGQDEAVDAIAHAVRRARSGINNPNRPMGSFLFLGPTGVGKTETTKALAEVFFGAEAHLNDGVGQAKIERLDMSEYTGAEALQKLIGSFESNRYGSLSKMLREHPYGVLLLDEFEKTTPEVLNLFLQILDEGFFSDMHGRKINARNQLIIATSNAGSDLIWEAVKKGNDLSHARELIIDSIIKQRVMKPELLNRFDGVIVFHPLASEHLEKIARLQLEKLKKRLAARGYNLEITKDLVDYVREKGTDPKFGARPMNRAIQDTVEQTIADKMIRGNIKPGVKIELSRADLGI